MKSFWIINISNRLISLGDLGVLLLPRKPVNLSDPKHYSFTEEQILKSLTTGSISKYKKIKKIKECQAPSLKRYKGPATINVEENNIFPSKIRSLLEHKEYNYDEDNSISDDEYAKENADLADEDDLWRFKK